jgi:hypothetical protein
MSTLKLTLPTNEFGNLESIGPVSGLTALAQRRGMDCEVVLYNPAQVDVQKLIDTAGSSDINGGGYSTDNYSDDEIPSIMEVAFQNTVRKQHQASIDKRDLKMQEEAFKADQRAPDAEEEANREAYEIWLEDRKADAAQGHQSSFEAPKTSAEADFWDEPNSDGNVVPFENTQTVNDKILTVRQTALLMFNNDSKEAMAIIHSKKMRKDLGAYSRGKGCKVFIPESKVRAFIAKQPKRLAGMAMYLPEHKMIGRKYHS